MKINTCVHLDKNVPGALLDALAAIAQPRSKGKMLGQTILGVSGTLVLHIQLRSSSKIQRTPRKGDKYQYW